MSSSYNQEEVYNIRSINIIFILFWLLLIFIFKLFTKNAVFVLFIPIILFLISFINADYFSPDSSESIMQTTFVSIGLLVAIPMLSFMKTSSKNTHHISSILLTAMCLTLLSYLHVWLPPKSLYIWKHCRSCLETMAVTLFIYVLITFYIECNTDPVSKIIPSESDDEIDK